ncbi:MAG: SMP-30/gluconolactonase/LRE family protein [Pseudomonadota bacterium]
MLIIPALIVVGYFGLWPVPVEPVAWQAPKAPGYVGVYASNAKLAGLRQIALGAETGPEHVCVGPDGKLYTGVVSGHILRMQPDGNAQEVFSDTGGRPLGMAFDAAGNLIVADALKGLLSIAPDGRTTVLAGAGEDAPLRFPNALALARSGKIYLSDSSMRFTPARWGSTLEAATLDVLEQSATGRVFEYDPAGKSLRLLATGLSFANGVALSADEQSLFVSESARYRVWKLSIGAESVDVATPSAQARPLLENLPGYPDNLTRGFDGRIWLGLSGPRNDLDAMAQHPFLRRLMLRIPRALWPTPKPYGHVIAFDEDGKVLVDLQDPSGNAALTTGATETPGRLYIQNADAHSLGWLER